MCFTYSVQYFWTIIKGLVVKRISSNENFVRKVPPFLPIFFLFFTLFSHIPFLLLFSVMMLVCRGSGAQGKYNIYGTPSFMHTHFGFNKGILTIARQYPTPVSIKWKMWGIISLNFKSVPNQGPILWGST